MKREYVNKTIDTLSSNSDTTLKRSNPPVSFVCRPVNSLELQEISNYNFPELDESGVTTYVTNTAYLIFAFSGHCIVYDLLDKDDNNANFNFDSSILERYDEFKTPLNHFYVRYDPSGIIPQLVYESNNKYYYKIPADFYGSNEAKDNGLFKLSDKIESPEYLTELKYKYTQVIRIKNVPSGVTINGKAPNSSNIIDIYPSSFGNITLKFMFNNVSGSGSMEVIC